MKTNSCSIEPLEARIAPAALLNPQTVIFTDVDGDAVTVKTSKGSWDLANDFVFAPAGAGEILQRLELASKTEFQGAVVTINATTAGGDGFVGVGFINAAGIDLAGVKIDGDLGRISVGDGVSKTPALGVLKVNTLGALGTSTQEPGGNLTSNVEGALGKLRVEDVFFQALFSVKGGSLGSIGSVYIGGDMSGSPVPGSGSIYADGNIGPVKIFGSILAGPGTSSGQIQSDGSIASVFVKGGVIGAGNDSGTIRANGNLGPVFIGGDLFGANAISAQIKTVAGGSIASVTIMGSVFGGAGTASGVIGVDGGGNIGPVKIGGSLLGAGAESGSVRVSGNGSIASVTIGGDVMGGAFSSGRIQTGGLGNIGLVKIGGSLTGGTGQYSGSIVAFGGSIASATVGNNVLGGAGAQSGSIGASGDLGSVKVGSNLAGSTGSESGVILSRNGDIKLVKIGGSVSGGAGLTSGAILAEHGDLVAVTVDGAVSGGDVFGTDSALNSGFIGAQNIKSVLVKGSVFAGSNLGSGLLVNSGAIRANHAISSVTILGNTVGSSTNPVIISGLGQLVHGPGVDLAIGAVKIGKAAVRTQILAGYDWLFGVPVNADAQIGQIRVNGDWAESIAVAGVVPGLDGFFATQDDASIPTITDQPGIVSRIAKIAVGGSVTGSAAPGDNFGFVAQHIIAIRVGGTIITRTPGPGNDLAPISLGAATGDMTVLEVV